MLRVPVSYGNSSNCVAPLEPFLSGFRARSEFMCGIANGSMLQAQNGNVGSFTVSAICSRPPKSERFPLALREQQLCRQA
jgi:hypothetical protein